MAHSNTPRDISIRWFHEVWNDRNTALIPELMAEDAVGHLEGGMEIVGPEAFIRFQQSLLEALPDIQVQVMRCLADDDEACVLWQATATHTGQGMGLMPTGKKVTFHGTSWYKVKDGKFIEGWDSWNQGALMSVLSGKA